MKQLFLTVCVFDVCTVKIHLLKSVDTLIKKILIFIVLRVFLDMIVMFEECKYEKVFAFIVGFAHGM